MKDYCKLKAHLNSNQVRSDVPISFLIRKPMRVNRWVNINGGVSVYIYLLGCSNQEINAPLVLFTSVFVDPKDWRSETP